jgi:hypothetical protein
VVAGHLSGDVAFATTTIETAGATDAFVAKLDGSGAPVWLRAFGNHTAQHVESLSIAPSDAVVVSISSAGGFLDAGAGRQRGDSFVLALAP